MSEIMSLGFNKNHPELERGEMFLTNISLSKTYYYWMPEYWMPEPRARMNEWTAIGWSTKRLGNFAYDIRGNIIPELRPVFVQEREIQKAGVLP